MRLTLVDLRYISSRALRRAAAITTERPGTTSERANERPSRYAIPDGGSQTLLVGKKCRSVL